MTCQPTLLAAANFGRLALQQQPRDAWWTISLFCIEGRGRQMTNVGRAVEHASMQVMFPGHISLLFLTSALCLTKVEASTVSTRHKRTDLALADKVKIVNMLGLRLSLRWKLPQS